MTITLNATTGISTPAETTVGDESVGGNLTVAGTTNIGGTLSVTGNTTVTGTLTASGGVSGGIRSATAQASTSGTSIDFTSIPAGVKRITVMFSGVSTNGTSNKQIQVGSGSFTTTGYVGATGYVTTATSPASVTTGFGLVTGGTAADTNSGLIILTNITGNNWVCSGTTSTNNAAQPGMIYTNGQISLGGTLDRVRITTVNGTDTFDAGSINILYE